MIFTQWKLCAGSCTIMFAFISYSAFYAYQVNIRRKLDDPEKGI